MRSGPLTGTLSPLCCLNHFTTASPTSLVSCFHNRFILLPFCSNALIILDFFFQIVWIVEFQISSPGQLAFFTFIICHISLTFPSTLKTFHIFVTVAMLSRCQSPVNCRNRNAQDNCKQNANYRYYCNFLGLEFMWLLEKLEDLPSQGQRDSRIFNIAYILENVCKM